ncbi:hypothetical protein FMEAI12_7120005 [Parafrankia sp. Ea1.12]|nr:hypothetical protein FMEAI12_7120005 [Parafrankia sp. Ea1.12]
MAPEQLLGEHAGPAADVFAWALCVAFAATGRQPFAGSPVNTPVTSALRRLNAEPDLDGVPEALRPLLRRAHPRPHTEPTGTGPAGATSRTGAAHHPPAARPGRRDDQPARPPRRRRHCRLDLVQQWNRQPGEGPQLLHGQGCRLRRRLEHLRPVRLPGFAGEPA